MSRNNADKDKLERWGLPAPEAIDRMIELAHRFRSESVAIEKHRLDTGAPVPQEPYNLEIHPASGEFFDAIHNDGWVMMGWDYYPWHDEHKEEFNSTEWIKSLSLREIQKWLTYYSRDLRGSSLYPKHSITQDMQSGVLLNILDRIKSLKDN